MSSLKTVIILAVLTLFSAFQSMDDPKKLIVKKWKLNETEMKKVIKGLIVDAFAQQGATATDEQVATESDNAWNMLKSMTMEFKADGTFESISDAQGNVKGKWTISDDGKQLMTQREGNPERKFKVIKLNKDELVLETGQPQMPMLAMISY